MTREEIYDKVNRCKTYEELSDVILSISKEGKIQGRSREFGIRQQALYIYYYTHYD